MLKEAETTGETNGNYPADPLPQNPSIDPEGFCIYMTSIAAEIER